MNEKEYVCYRMKNGYGNDRADDRCSNEKKMKDAELRGSLGCRKANELISVVDRLHSTR